MSKTLQGHSRVSGSKGSSVLATGKQLAFPGFSLLELVIVIAVIAIIIAVAVPDLTIFNRTYKIRNSADSVANLVNLARMRAAATFSRVEVLCSNTTNQCSLQTEAYNSTTFSADVNKQTVTLSTGVSFGTPATAAAGAGGQSAIAPYQGSSAQTISYAMIFNSRGLPIANNTTGTAVSDYALYFAGPNNSYMAVAADGSGKPYEYIWSGTAWQLATN